MSQLLDRLILNAVNLVSFASYPRATWRFWRSVGRMPRLSPPIRHNDKYFWRKIHDCNPAFQTFCDKLACKEWVKQRCPDLRVPATLWQGTSAKDMPDELLKAPCFVKASNGSGYNIRIDGGGADRDAIEAQFSRWLARAYGQGNAEWGYKHVPRKVFVEEIVVSPGGGAPLNANVYSAGGQPAVVFCITGWKDQYRQGSMFDLKGNRLADQPDDLDPLPVDWTPPPEFFKVVEYSKHLVHDIDQVRCDFLCADGQVWFGEMTPYPLSGLGSFDSLEDEALMYGKWDLSRSWFMRSEHSGWRKLYAAAMRRSLTDSGTA